MTNMKIVRTAKTETLLLVSRPRLGQRLFSMVSKSDTETVLIFVFNPSLIIESRFKLPFGS
jgi:hypothetical protein